MAEITPDQQKALALAAARLRLQESNPTSVMSGTEKFLAGAGKAFSDVARGMRQLAPGAPTTQAALARSSPEEVPAIKRGIEKTQAEVDEAKRLDAPLMKTGAGLAGNVVGNAALFAPTVAVPGANTYTGAAALGSVAGAMQPVATGESRALNTGLGAAAGMAGQAIGRGISRAITPVASRLSPEAEGLAQAAEREGIPLTAGQRTGSKPLQITESVMENLPFTSGPQLAGREAQSKAFTAAALRRAGMASDVADAGGMLAQKNNLGKSMGDIAERNALDFNQGGLMTKLADIVSDASRKLPKAAADDVAQTVDNVLAEAPNGVMAGAKYQGWREPLRAMADSTAQGRYYGQIRKALDEAFSSQLQGADAEAFKTASRQYANLKTIIDAMGGPGSLPAKGQLAPAQLSAALARAVGKENKTLGVGDLNELSRIGQTFIKGQIPDSGTAQRQLITSLLTGGGGAGIGAGTAAATGHDPLEGAAYGLAATGAGLAAPRLVQALMNSPGGQAYLANSVLSPEARAALTAALRTGAIASAPALASQ